VNIQSRILRSFIRQLHKLYTLPDGRRRLEQPRPGRATGWNNRRLEEHQPGRAPAWKNTGLEEHRPGRAPAWKSNGLEEPTAKTSQVFQCDSVLNSPAYEPRAMFIESSAKSLQCVFDIFQCRNPAPKV